MKKLFLATALVFSAAAFAQDVKTGNTKAPEIMGNVLIIEDDACQMVFTEDASFKDGKLTIECADSITFDIVAQAIVVTGPYSYSFDGAVQVSNHNDKKQLRYKIGDDKLYLEL